MGNRKYFRHKCTREIIVIADIQYALSIIRAFFDVEKKIVCMKNDECLKVRIISSILTIEVIYVAK